MDKIFAAIWGIMVVVGVLIPVGIALCFLLIWTKGSIPVLIAGAGLGIAFACYCGYRAALAALGGPPQGKPLVWMDADESSDRAGPLE